MKLQELLRRHPGFSPRVLECSLLAIVGDGSAGKGGPSAGGGVAGADPGGKIAGDSAGAGGAGVAGKVAATERTKTVLACLFEALGQQRATREVARVFCAMAARTAQAMADAASAAGEGAGRVAVVLVPAAEAVAPRALLPVLESMPPQSANGVGLAMEVLETGQAAADALARAGGAAAARDGRVVVFDAVDASGRCAGGVSIVASVDDDRDLSCCGVGVVMLSIARNTVDVFPP